VRIDRGHFRWFLFSTGFLVVACVTYALYARGAPGGPTGGSAMGLTFGIAGTAFMLYAALLGVRKKRPHYRVGRAATWLKGHLWLGALSFPLVFFHAGFEFGGPLAKVLMWIFILVFLTGLFGLALQQILPRFMTQNLPQEVVYEQIDHVRQALLEEAELLVTGATRRNPGVGRAKSDGAIHGRIVESRAVPAVQDGADRAPLVRFLDKHLKFYFQPRGPAESPLADPNGRQALFEELRCDVEPRLHGVVADLEAYCEQRGQLEAQRRLHHWLHGWLLIHVPLSWTVIFLTAVHAVMSLYY
jgi:hypothetical protein